MSKSANNGQASTGKRKRSIRDEGNDAGSNQASKKQQIARLNVQWPKQPLLRTLANRQNSVAETTVVTTTLITNSQHSSVPKELTHQLPTPPSSNASPECERHTKERQESSCRSTPTPAEKTQERQNSPQSTGAISGLNKKRQRDETDGAEEAPKRLRQMKAATSAKLQRMPPAHQPQAQALQLSQESKSMKPVIEQRILPARQMQAKAVRPESSFAPVTANHERDLTFLDYDHDSVPVLYSTKISHTHGTELLNCPQEMLVLDALAAIEASSKPQSKYAWPSAIELLGRIPCESNPTRVLDDVDLYLHERDSKLHVATDRGLIIVTEYLKLIGVPETQPVRFEGCIPLWAKAALRAREKRRVVRIWGEEKTVKKGTPLGSHQVAMVLESHVEVRNERAKEAKVKATLHADEVVKTPTVEEHKKGKAEDKTVPRAPMRTETAAEQNNEKEEILQAVEGDLPLPFGSAVVVYKVDDDDVWAYGRLSGTDKKGRFPICHTCPLDWSLDRFTRTNDSLRKPLPDSIDPDEKGWNGLAHWIQQKGYPKGPTWAETLTAAAAGAKAAKKRNIVARKASINTKATLTLEVVKTSAERSTSDNAPSNRPFPITTPGATTSTRSSTTAATSTTMQTRLEGATAGILDTGIAKVTETADVFGLHADVCADSAQAADDIFKTQNRTTTGLEMQQVGTNGVNTETSITSGCEAQDYVTSDAAQQPEVPEPKEEESAVDVVVIAAHSPRNPFTVLRYDPFARNDDIEYDWGDSDEEL